MSAVLTLLSRRLPLVSNKGLITVQSLEPPTESDGEVRASLFFLVQSEHGILTEHVLVPRTADLSEARACTYVAAFLDFCQEVLDEREQALADGAPFALENEVVPLYDLPEDTPHPLASPGGDALSFREALVQVRKRQLAALAAEEERDAQVRAVLEPTTRTLVRLRLQAVKEDITGSRLGGVPYLPEGVEYPRDAADGAPLLLAAQIDLSELGGRLDGYPSQGIFQLFVRNEPGHGIGLPGAPQGARVVYYPEVDAARARPRAWFDFLPDPISDDAPGAHEHALEFERDQEWMSRTDHRFGELVKAAGLDISDFDGDERVCSSAGNKLGGYPGCYTGDDARGADAYRGLGYELFLQLDSTESVPVRWGRDHALKIYVLPDDLVRGDFSRVLLDLS